MRSIIDICNDNRSGSEKIVKDFLNYIRCNTKNLKKDAESLLEAHPDMMAVAHMAKFIISIKPEEVLEKIDGYIRELDRVQELLTIEGLSHIEDGSIIFTHSYSSSVAQVLFEAKKQGRDFSVILTESRPMYEGVDFATDLVSKGIHTTLITDSAMGLYISKATKVLLGADAFNEEFFLNKTGSYPICLCAAEFNKEVIVMASQYKYGKCTIDQKLFPSNEVLETNKDICIENPYFEAVPLKLVYKLIT